MGVIVRDGQAQLYIDNNHYHRNDGVRRDVSLILLCNKRTLQAHSFQATSLHKDCNSAAEPYDVDQLVVKYCVACKGPEMQLYWVGVPICTYHLIITYMMFSQHYNEWEVTSIIVMSSNCNPHLATGLYCGDTPLL